MVLVFSFMDWSRESILHCASLICQSNFILAWTWHGFKAMWWELSYVPNGCRVKRYKQCSSIAAMLYEGCAVEAQRRTLKIKIQILKWCFNQFKDILVSSLNFSVCPLVKNIPRTIYCTMKTRLFCSAWKIRIQLAHLHATKEVFWGSDC